MMDDISKTDNEIYDLLKKELGRQQHGLEMIPSENNVSKAVMQAMGSVLTNKYSEGYPKKRYYGGNQFADEVELLAIERAKKFIMLFTSMCSLIPAVPQILQFTLQSCSQMKL